jgi:hypothetical protein
VEQPLVVQVVDAVEELKRDALDNHGRQRSSASWYESANFASTPARFKVWRSVSISWMSERRSLLLSGPIVVGGLGSAVDVGEVLVQPLVKDCEHVTPLGIVVEAVECPGGGHGLVLLPEIGQHEPHGVGHRDLLPL